MSLIAGRYATAADRGTPVRTVGMQLQRQLSPILSATLEAAGAATGEADGYAEFLAGALALRPVGAGPLHLGLRAAVGLGGGGAVPTGGGPIAKAAVAGWLPLGSQLSLGLEAGHARAFDGAFNSRYAQLTLGLAFADAAPAADATAPARVGARHAMGRQRAAVPARAQGRRQRRQPEHLGTEVPACLERTCLSHRTGAQRGRRGAGAYSAGLIGPGGERRMAAATHWSVGAEALIGAGGGGGVASHGGALVQPMGWIRRELGLHSRLQLGAGYLKSLRGELSSAVVDLSWALAFGVP